MQSFDVFFFFPKKANIQTMHYDPVCDEAA